MVQNGLGDFEPNAELLEARRHGPANVVQSPIRDAARLVQLHLGVAEPVEGTAKAREDVIASVLARDAAQQRLHRDRKRDAWASPFFARLAGIVQDERLSSSSAQVMPATSSRRWPVETSVRTIALYGPGRSVAFQTAESSSSESTRSRVATGASGNPRKGCHGERCA